MRIQGGGAACKMRIDRGCKGQLLVGKGTLLERKSLAQPDYFGHDAQQQGLDLLVVTAALRVLPKPDELALRRCQEKHLAPLRERRSDIPLLVEHFVAKFNERLKKRITRVEPDAMERLMSYGWGGNIRELENVLERTMLFCEGPTIRAGDLPPEVQQQGVPVTAAGASPSGPHPTLTSAGPRETPRPPSSLKELVRQETERVERELIMRALDDTGGNVTQAARRLKISRKSLQNKMKEFGLRDDK
jgi:DNA-binding NtrC family response regulator